MLASLQAMNPGVLLVTAASLLLAGLGQPALPSAAASAPQPALAAASAQPPQPETARVGPLEAWVGPDASGACQLHLRNVGDVPLEAWRVSVRSDDARRTTIVAHDGWRDPFHMPLEESQVEPGETVSIAVLGNAARGALTVRVHLVVRIDDIAHGDPEATGATGDAAFELRQLLDRRRGAAAEALAAAEATESAIASEGIDRVLATRRLSERLDTTGDWNWWEVTQQALAAEAAAARDPLGAARALRSAIALLREAHRRGTALIVLQPAEPARFVAAGRCS
jgi:hypothetical protein